MRFRSSLLIVASFASLVAAPAKAQQASPAPEADSAAGQAHVPSDRELLPPEYPPPGAKTAVIATGATLFAVWYGASVGASFLWNDEPGTRELRIPVVGPWLSLREAGCNGNASCDTFDVVARVVLSIADGVGQLGGLAAIVEGITMPTQREGAVPGSRTATPRPAALRVHAVPLAGRNTIGPGVGVQVTGSF